MEKEETTYAFLRKGSVHSTIHSPVVHLYTPTPDSINTTQNTLLAVYLDGSAHTWRGISQSSLSIVGVQDRALLTTAAWVNERVVAGLSTGRTVLVDGIKGTRLACFDDHGQKVSAVAMPNDKMLYSVGYDGVFQARNLSLNVVQHLYSACPCPISDMKLMEHAEEILIGNLEGNVSVIDLRKRDRSLEFDISTSNSPIRCMEVNRSNPFQVLISYGRGNVVAKDFRNLSQNIFHLQAVHQEAINCLLSDYENNRFYSGGDDCRCKIFDIHKGNEIESLEDLSCAVTSLCNYNGELLIGGIGRGIYNFNINQILQSKEKLEFERNEKGAVEQIQVQETIDIGEQEEEKAKKGKKEKPEKKGKSDKTEKKAEKIVKAEKEEKKEKKEKSEKPKKKDKKEDNVPQPSIEALEPTEQLENNKPIDDAKKEDAKKKKPKKKK